MKILIAVDGSEFTAKAIDYVLTHRHLLGAQPDLLCLHVSSPLPARAARAVGKEITDGYYADEVARATDRALKSLAKAGIETKLVVKRGSAGEEIAHFAQKQGVDLVIMGSHGHGALSGLVMGSVATRVLASCQVPVLLVR